MASLTGVVTVGNSGVGKSLLTNIIVGQNVFVHDVAPGSVTTVTEHVEFNSPNPEWGRVRVFNIPGLIEARAENVQRNKTELQQAFSQCQKQVVLYVFGSEGGRIRAEDIQAFVAIKRAYDLKPESVIFVFNKTPSKFDDTKKGQAISLAKGQVAESLGSNEFNQVTCIFVKNFGEDFEFNVQNPDIQSCRELIHSTIYSRVAVAHRKVAEIELNQNVEALNALNRHLEEMRKQMEDNRREFDRRLQTMMEQHAREQQEAADRYREALAIANNRPSGGGIVPIPICTIC